MTIFIPIETWPGETRVAIIPTGVRRLKALGADVAVESGLGSGLGFTDSTYRDAGAAIVPDRRTGIAAADVVLRLRPPSVEDVEDGKPGSIQIGFMDPFNRAPMLDALVRRGLTSLCVELIPRTTLAQKMDALSSQASLAGYAAVVAAAGRIQKAFPMMMTPAGTISPARVFVIGAGVAGLQAIATAKRLGARVEAFDTRPVVEEQVLSLGARFVKIDLGDTGQTKDGYARALTEEQIRRQRIAMAKHCADADVVITTAQVFGKRAPIIVTAEMVRGMKPGSVVVDLAVESGGNVEGIVAGQETVVGGVVLMGIANMPGRVALDASLMYSNNLCNLVEHFWDRTAGALRVDPTDEIMRGCLLTHGGRLVNAALQPAAGAGG